MTSVYEALTKAAALCLLYSEGKDCRTAILALRDSLAVQNDTQRSGVGVVEALEIMNSVRSETAASATAKDYEKLYHELLFAVGNRYSGETRHHTALRYILNAERGNVRAEQERRSGNEERDGAVDRSNADKEQG